MLPARLCHPTMRVPLTRLLLPLHMRSCLPPGSEVTFVNSHPAEDTLGVVLRGRSLQNLKVRCHTQVQPLGCMRLCPAQPPAAAAITPCRLVGTPQVSHVLADPLQRSQLAALPLGRFRAALVLADERWVDPDLDESNGIDAIDQPSVLRQDALMVMVQVRPGGAVCDWTRTALLVRPVPAC